MADEEQKQQQDEEQDDIVVNTAPFDPNDPYPPRPCDEGRTMQQQDHDAWEWARQNHLI